MLELPYLFGGMDVFDKAAVDGLNKTSKKALENLKRIYELLCLYGFEKFVSIDLGMLQSIDYYTGSIFKIYTHGVSFPVCAGGRYNNLMGNFGKEMGAVGVAFGINRILSALRNSGGDIDTAEPSASLLFSEKNADGLAYDLAYSLRVNGCLVEAYVGTGDYKKAEAYARRSGAGCMLRVFADGTLMINDFNKHEITETTVQDFLGYYEDEEEDACGCGHDHHDHDCGCHHH